MSKDRDLIFDMTEDPEVLTYPAADNEPLQLGGVEDGASAAADRQVTTPGDVYVAPQPVITQALLMASDLPVFVGVGGGLTTGKRVVNLAMYAEMQGAAGVVVNAPTPGRILNRIRSSVDVPVVVTVANSDTNYRHRIEDGAAILNVAAGAQTPEIVAEIRERFPDYPIIATGGADEDSIRATIRAGANAIIWTPPTNGELFRDVMKNYREGKPHP